MFTQVKPTLVRHSHIWNGGKRGTRARLKGKAHVTFPLHPLTNKILASLGADDVALLLPMLSPVELPVRRQLETPGRPIQYAHFMRTGIASIVVSTGGNYSVEVGIIGNEGVTGLPLLMKTNIAVHQTFMQSEGSAWRAEAADLIEAMERSPRLRDALLRYAHTFMVQMSFTALANGKYKLEERLARWLLMAQDRGDAGKIKLTHEFLGLMLGTRRAGVTIALRQFDKQGFIATRRGIIIKDRKRLEEAANGSYGTPEAEYERWFPGNRIKQSLLPAR